jgi:hypothetical protein
MKITLLFLLIGTILTLSATASLPVGGANADSPRST